MILPDGRMEVRIGGRVESRPIDHIRRDVYGYMRVKDGRLGKMEFFQPEPALLPGEVVVRSIGDTVPTIVQGPIPYEPDPDPPVFGLGDFGAGW